MTKKKKVKEEKITKEKITKEKYVKEPTFTKYKETIYSSEPQVRKYLYKIQKERERKYYKQEAQIKAGVKPSEKQAKIKQKKAKIKRVAKATVKEFFKPKLFKKPKAKPIKKLSATKLIQQMGKESGALVRELENPYADPVQDTRSQFFRESYLYEKRKRFGGFL